MYAPQETQKSEEYREVKRTKNSTVDYEYQQMYFFYYSVQKNMHGYLNKIVRVRNLWSRLFCLHLPKLESR